MDKKTRNFLFLSEYEELTKIIFSYKIGQGLNASQLEPIVIRWLQKRETLRKNLRQNKDFGKILLTSILENIDPCKLIFDKIRRIFSEGNDVRIYFSSLRFKKNLNTVNSSEKLDPT